MVNINSLERDGLRQAELCPRHTMKMNQLTMNVNQTFIKLNRLKNEQRKKKNRVLIHREEDEAERKKERHTNDYQIANDKYVYWLLSFPFFSSVCSHPTT